MAEQKYRYTLHAVVREEQGKGASRRLRRQGLVPAIIYGGNTEPQAIAIKQDELKKNAKNHSFFSQIINLKIDGQEDQEILVRDVQHHIYKPLFQHFDFQRIVRGQEITATVLLEFVGEERAPGVKTDGGIVSRHMTTVEVICRPSLLPEYIAVDLSEANIGDIITLADLKLPEGVRLVGDMEDEEFAATVVVQISYPQREEQMEDTDTDTAAADEEGDKEENADKQE